MKTIVAFAAGIVVAGGAWAISSNLDFSSRRMDTEASFENTNAILPRAGQVEETQGPALNGKVRWKDGTPLGEGFSVSVECRRERRTTRTGPGSDYSLKLSHPADRCMLMVWLGSKPISTEVEFNGVTTVADFEIRGSSLNNNLSLSRASTRIVQR